MEHVRISNAKVLIVEDEFLVAMQLEDMLCDEGYSVVGCLPDHASLQSVQQTPDIALVDLNLRDGPSGPAIAREIARQYGARVIYVTANPDEIGEPVETAVGVVQKPFSRTAILGAIQYALKQTETPPPEMQPFIR